MKKYITFLQRISFVLTSIVILSACTSTTLITSIPYTYSDTKIVGSVTHVSLEKEGYVPYSTLIVRNEEVDVGAVIGGFICTVPWLWIMKYQPEHTYELMPLAEDY